MASRQNEHAAGSNSGVNRQIVDDGTEKAQVVENQDTKIPLENPEPPYYKEIRTDAAVYSLDNLRLSLSVPANKWDVLTMKLDVASGKIAEYWSSNRIGQYRCLWTVKIDEETSFSVGLGLNKPTGKVDQTKGFLDFNPNKVREDKTLQKIFNLLFAEGVNATVKRLDLAMDLPGDRGKYTLLKDRRSYEYFADVSRTEYLGRKSQNGRVKLYDKLAEMGLDGKIKEQVPGLTRIELTVPLDLSEVLRMWPRVLDSQKVQGLKGKDFAFLVALLDLVQLGAPIEKYLGLVKPWTANRYRKLLEPSTIQPDTDSICHILRQADEWCKFGQLISY